MEYFYSQETQIMSREAPLYLKKNERRFFGMGGKQAYVIVNGTPLFGPHVGCINLTSEYLRRLKRVTYKMFYARPIKQAFALL